MKIVVNWNGHKFNPESFIKKACMACPCSKWQGKGAERRGTCKSRCLCGAELPVDEAVKRLYKPNYYRNINRRSRTVVLEVTGFYCEGRSVESLYKPKDE